MLINKKTNNAPVVLARPTESGNGFVKGETYIFHHHNNGLYRTVLNNGHEKFDSFGDKSAHLWDAKNWDAAGHFEIIEIKNEC